VHNTALYTCDQIVRRYFSAAVSGGQTRQLSWWRVLRSYGDVTTFHGVRYITQPSSIMCRRYCMKITLKNHAKIQSLMLRRHRFPNGDSRVRYSVKTTSLPHTPNDLFDQIWLKGVPFGSFVQKYSTPTLQPPEI